MENKKIDVNKILEICKGKLISGDRNKEIISYSNDTRKIQNGDMYLAIKGDRVNGNDYIEVAFKNGAIGCITDEDIKKSIKDKYKNKIIIKVEDTIKALQNLAKYKRSMYDIPVIAVTGSVRENKYKRYNSKCFISKI